MYIYIYSIYLYIMAKGGLKIHVTVTNVCSSVLCSFWKHKSPLHNLKYFKF